MASAAAGGAAGSASMSAAPSRSASSATGGAGGVSPAARCSGARATGARLRARLTYAISGQDDAIEDLLLTYRYGREGVSPSAAHEVELDCAPGRRAYAFCPACGRRVRTLYAPPGAELFACRVCYRLVYRRSRAGETARLRAARSPVRRCGSCRRCRSAPGGGRGVATYPRLPPRSPASSRRSRRCGEAETRLWCLRLRAAGLSYRQIAALLEISKSSVARYCVAGRKAHRAPRPWCANASSSASARPRSAADDDLRGLDAYLRALHHHALRLGLYHHPLSESEERVVIAGDGALEP